MKALAIALKDLTSSFRSSFALIFMFGLPLAVSGLFYFMFSSQADPASFDLALTRVVIADLDGAATQPGSLGAVLVKTLQSEDFAEIIEASQVETDAAARQAVQAGQAGVAILIPPGFSAAFNQPGAVTEIELIQGLGQEIGAAIVNTIVGQVTDAYSGAKIAAAAAQAQVEAGRLDSAQSAAATAAYLAAAQNDAGELVTSRAPGSAPQEPTVLSIVAPIMTGMMIMFAFFTGVYTASTILREEEDGTLPRIFTTPSRQAEILGGKFLAVGLTVAVQVVILMVCGRLIFSIHWGALPAVLLAAAALVASAAAFGVLVCSLLKNSRQGSVIFGGVLSTTGMIGLIDVFTGSARMGFVPLLTPQGWAARGLLLAMDGAALSQVLPYSLALLAFSLAFFTIGVWRFQRRYA